MKRRDLAQLIELAHPPTKQGKKKARREAR
jgi:hypothetical protein